MAMTSRVACPINASQLYLDYFLHFIMDGLFSDTYMCVCLNLEYLNPPWACASQTASLNYEPVCYKPLILVDLSANELKVIRLWTGRNFSVFCVSGKSVIAFEWKDPISGFCFNRVMQQH